MDGCLDSSRVCGSWELYPYKGHETAKWSTMDVAQYGWLSNNSEIHNSGVWEVESKELMNSTQELHLYEGYEAA
jgi:hypothetical protein